MNLYGDRLSNELCIDEKILMQRRTDNERKLYAGKLKRMEQRKFI